MIVWWEPLEPGPDNGILRVTALTQPDVEQLRVAWGEWVQTPAARRLLARQPFQLLWRNGYLVADWRPEVKQ